MAGASLGVAALWLGFLAAGHVLVAPEQAPVKADLLVALGGDNGARADRVLELYRKGLAPMILLAGPEGRYSKTRETQLSWRARYLVDEGIPQQVLLFDRRSRSSWEAAVETLRRMQAMKL